MKIQRRVCRNEKRESTGQILTVSKVRIIFVRMKSGKSMPVNPNFVNFRRDGGKDRIVLANGEVTSGTIVTDPGEAQGFGYVSHFATCEYAQTFRRK